MFFPSHPPVSIRKYFRKSAEEIEKSREKQINDLLKANQQLQEQVSSMTQGPNLGFFQCFFFKTYFPLVKAVHHLESTFFQRPSAPRKVGAKRMARVISNDLPIKAPRNLTVLDNTLLFLPEKAVREFNLEPNMNDKGDEDRGFLTRRRGGVVSRFFWGWPNKFFLAGFLGWNMMEPMDLEVTMGLVIFRDKAWHLTPTQRSVERDSSDSLMWWWRKSLNFRWMIFQPWFPDILFSQDKYMWVGRVWELRALLMHQSNDKVQTITTDSEQLSEFRKRELKAKLKDPELRPRLKRLAARWNVSSQGYLKSIKFLWPWPHGQTHSGFGIWIMNIYDDYISSHFCVWNEEAADEVPFAESPEPSFGPISSYLAVRPYKSPCWFRQIPTYPTYPTYSYIMLVHLPFLQPIYPDLPIKISSNL